jgi:hypothetical protein
MTFAAIVSHFKGGSTEGEIELRNRGDGVTKKTWEDIKKEEPGGSQTGFPWLREQDSNHGGTCQIGEPGRLSIEEAARIFAVVTVFATQGTNSGQ